jgi:hypothetical protein
VACRNRIKSKRSYPVAGGYFIFAECEHGTTAASAGGDGEIELTVNR